MASAAAGVTTTSNSAPPVPSFVEMRDFAAPLQSRNVEPLTMADAAPTSTSEAAPSSSIVPPTNTSAAATSQPQSSQDQPTQQSASTLGPAIEGVPVIATPSSPEALVLSITLMTSTGARHPYRIDEKYLSARSVASRTSTGTFDPRELKGYSLKELIWTDWREEWEPRPASPDKIRLIIMGKLVDDKKALKEYPFSFDLPNVVQISVKPSDFEDDNDAAHAKGHKPTRVRDGDDERGAGCRCVVM